MAGGGEQPSAEQESERRALKAGRPMMFTCAARPATAGPSTIPVPRRVSTDGFYFAEWLPGFPKRSGHTPCRQRAARSVRCSSRWLHERQIVFQAHSRDEPTIWRMGVGVWFGTTPYRCSLRDDCRVQARIGRYSFSYLTGSGGQFRLWRATPSSSKTVLQAR